jgi:uncharacterized membrane protein YkvA (DUF1232 family)
MNQEQRTVVPGEIVDETNSSPIRSLLFGIVAVFMVIYLLNPLGPIDFVPDVIPFIGNLDEATATTILVVCLSHFGIKIPGMKK